MKTLPSAPPHVHAPAFAPLPRPAFTDPPESRPTVHHAPPPLGAVDAAFQLGYDFAGCAGEYDPPPAFDADERAAFIAGFSLGRERNTLFRDVPADPAYYADAAHWDSWADSVAVGLPDLDAGDLAALHGDDHDAQPDPNAVEAWAQPSDDYWDSLSEFEDAHAPDDWSERARIIGHRVHAAAEGGAR